MKLKIDSDYEIKTKEFGMEFALLKLAQKLNFEKIIDGIVYKHDQGLSVGQPVNISISPNIMRIEAASRFAINIIVAINGNDVPKSPKLPANSLRLN